MTIHAKDIQRRAHFAGLSCGICLAGAVGEVGSGSFSGPRCPHAARVNIVMQSKAARIGVLVFECLNWHITL
jgi:hypothetical protein